MLNNVSLTGRLTKDPELRYTPDNIPVTSFTLAVDRDYKSGDERETDFIDVVAWRSSAEFVCKNFKKGQLMTVTGSIQTRTYTDKENNKRKAVEINADRCYFGDSKKQADNAGEKMPPPCDESDADTGFDPFN